MSRPDTDTDLLAALRVGDTGAESEINLEGSKALYLAVLKEAIQCLHGLETEDAEERQLAWRAKRWIEVDDWDDAFSFNNVCAALDLHPTSVRRRLVAANLADAAKPKLTYSVGRRTKVRTRDRSKRRAS